MSDFKTRRSAATFRLRICQPFPVNVRRNFGRFDFAPSAPENIGVGNRNAARLKMSIYRRLVIEEPRFVGAVRDRHDVDVLEFRTGFTPVTMGQDVMPADFAAGLDLAPGGTRPMKQSIQVVARKTVRRSFRTRAR